MPFFPPHEMIAEELSARPKWKEELQASIAKGEWPPVYTEHKVVQEVSPRPCLPVAIYFDGVRFNRRDSSLCFVINMLTGKGTCLQLFGKFGCVDADAKAGAVCGLS